jgi:uncharacterized protein YbjT (DUF2867 family)
MGVKRKGMILVTGSTGTISSALVEELAALGAPTRALVHTPEKTSIVEREGVEVTVGDLGSPETLDAALEGVERAFLLTPPDPHQPEWEKNLIEAAECAGVRHVVKLSALGSEANSPVRFLRNHADGERVLEKSELSWTFLRPNSFMQNMLSNAWSIASERRLYSPILDAKVTLIDARDVAAVAARMLTEEGHEGKVYELTGPEAISNREAAERLSTVLGRPIECVEVSFEDARRAMVGGGMPEWQAAGVIELARLQEAGYAAVLTNGVAEVTGRGSRRFEEFARDYENAFLGDSSAES